MKKENVYKFLYIVVIFLIIGFIIRLGVDYFKYYEIYTLPFYYYIIERFLEFILIFSLSILITKPACKLKYLNILLTK